MTIDLNLLMYVFAVGLLLVTYTIFGIYFLMGYYNLTREKGGLEKKENLLLFYGCFFILIAAGQLIFSIFDLITVFNSINWNSDNIILWKIGTTLQICGFGLIFTLMEKRVLQGKDKYILVIIFFISYVIGMILSDIKLATTVIMVSFICAIYIPLSYGYIAVKSEGMLRRKALYVLLGFIVFFIGTDIVAERILLIISNLTGLERIQIHVISQIIKELASGLIFLGYKK